MRHCLKFSTSQPKFSTWFSTPVEKVFITSQFYTVYPHFTVVFALCPPLSVWSSKNRQKWKSGRACLFFSTFLAFSTRVFHSQGKTKSRRDKEKRKKTSKRPLDATSFRLPVFLPTDFPHLKKSAKSAKRTTDTSFCAFPQFPQALLILLLTIYIILSL